ncbi:DoxX family protein [Halobacterium zhouii]|uniref:DoxX family protein n=1 Tax=Halobacterium zhouii TaxID=2902624 RepID=UPI001E3441DD|nr:DoxX family protein [Halobacterium zhouii]
MTGTAAAGLLVGRLLFGLVFVFQGVNHFQNVDYMSGYAESKGIPAARLLTVVSGVMLVLGGLAVAAGAYATLGAAAIAVFLLVATPLMHDFWAVPEDQAEGEMTHFLKNLELLGAALVVLAISTVEWQYALGVGLF